MWPALVGVVVGGVIGISGSVVLQLWEDRRRRRALAGASAAEIGAICAIARRRRYLEHLERLLEAVRESQQPGWMAVKITHDYMTIYHSNANAIGLLPPELACDVAQFYTQVKALMEDVSPDGVVLLSAEGAGELIELLTETLQLGGRVVERLREAAR